MAWFGLGWGNDLTCLRIEVEGVESLGPWVGTKMGLGGPLILISNLCPLPLIFFTLTCQSDE